MVEIVVVSLLTEFLDLLNLGFDSFGIGLGDAKGGTWWFYDASPASTVFQLSRSFNSDSMIGFSPSRSI